MYLPSHLGLYILDHIIVFPLLLNIQSIELIGGVCVPEVSQDPTVFEVKLSLQSDDGDTSGNHSVYLVGCHGGSP